MHPPRSRIPYRVAAFALFILWALLCTAEIASWWQWGHLGFNGASFAQGARNTFRYGMLGPFLWHTELSAPDPHSAYAHHPLLVHLHALLARLLSGGSDAPWVYRVTPALYSFGSLVVLWDLARRTGGRGYAWLTAAIYVSLPGMAIFASVPIHEQGTLFWILAGVWAELRYVATHRATYRALTFLSFFLALNFGWAAYFAAFLVFFHALLRAFLQHRHPRARRRPLFLALGLTAVVALSACLFLLWAAWAKGGLTELLDTFRWRAGTAEGTSRLALARRATEQLYGWTPVVLYALFLPTLALRAVRRRPEAMVALLFVLTQVLHTSIFRQAAGIHAYWEYYAAPGLALGAALAVRAHWSLPRRLSSPVARGVGKLIPVAAVLALLTVQLPYAVRQRAHGLRTAGLSGWEQDHSDALRWLAEVARLYPHGSAHFTFVQTLEDRPEVRHTVDGPVHFVRSDAQPKQRDGVTNLLLADLGAVKNERLRARLRRRAERAGRLWDDRFLVIDPALEAERAPRQYRSIRAPAGPLFRWFVHRDAPRVHWTEASHRPALHPPATASP